MQMDWSAGVRENSNLIRGSAVFDLHDLMKQPVLDVEQVCRLLRHLPSNPGNQPESMKHVTHAVGQCSVLNADLQSVLKPFDGAGATVSSRW